MGITVKLEGNPLGKISKNKLEKATYMTANQMMSDMDQFVPYKAGDLSGSAHLTRLPGNTMRISYTTPYARRQFYGVGIANYTRTVHPQATKRWDLKAKSLYMNDWVHAFQKGALK